MTLQLTFGIDPGISGAIAVVVDGKPNRFLDMPLVDRDLGSGRMIDGAALQAQIRGIRQQHVGAYCFAAIERVGGHRGQGGAVSFNFGQADGTVRTVFACLGIPLIEVWPVTWKNYFQLPKDDKDGGRQLVLRQFPGLEPELRRKKDQGRAEAFLVARWALLTEQVARVA